MMITYISTRAHIYTHIYTVTTFIPFAKLLPYRVKGQTNQT